MLIDVSRCLNYNDFFIKLNGIEKNLESKTQDTKTLNKILEFLKANQEIFIQEKGAAISLDSLAAKLRHVSGNEPLMKKLRSYVSLIIPSAPKDIKDFLEHIKNTIFDPSQRIQAIADWIDLMRIPLDQLDFTEGEFVALVTRLEYPDLTHFDFRSMDLKKLTLLLLRPNLKFKTTDTIFLSTLAKLCALQCGGSTACFIQNFAILDETDRIEIAKLCAQKNGVDTAQFIRQFTIGDEDALVKIARLCAKSDGGMAKYIQNFPIKDELIRIEIAKLCAQENGDRTACHIGNFSIADESVRIEIAKLCAQCDASMAKYMQNFAIEDEAARVEIAKLCANHNGFMARYIENFTIAKESARIEIAKLCAQKKSGSNAVEFIKNFAIEDEIARVEIAKFCAQQHGRWTARHIRNFAITDEKARIEIAKLCVQKDCEGAVEFIQNFVIEDEVPRIEIARLCAQQDGGWTAENIENFAIENKVAIVEIAKLCAKQDGEKTASHIKEFAIKDEQVRIEIAKLCAQQNGRGTAIQIGNFAIINETGRIEIARLCAQQSGEGTVDYINNFQIANPHSLYQLFLACVEADMKSLFHMDKISFFLPTVLLKISQMIHVLKKETSEEFFRNELFQEIRVLIEKLSISKENQKIILGMSSKIQALPPHLQNAACLWFVSSLLLIRGMKPSNIEWLLETGIWSELGLLKDPGLKVSLSIPLYALSADEHRSKLWDRFLSSVRGTEGQRGLMLLAILFSNLRLVGIEEEKLLAVANHLSTLQRKNESSFRNVYQVKNLLRTMHSLASINELTSEQKQRGFEKIFCEQSGYPHAIFNDEGRILKNVIAAKGLLQHKDTQWPDGTENLDVLFRSFLEKLIPLEQFKGDVSAKYEEVFGACRNPDGLLTYAAGLESLKEPALLSCLGQYVVSVMEGTFKNTRYEATQNLHLAKVLEGNPGLLSLWTEEIKLDLHTMISEDKKEDSFDSVQWLHTKLLVDKHLGSEELSYLIEFIKAPSPEVQKGTFSALIKKIKELMQEEENKKLRDELEKAKKELKEIQTKLKKESENQEVVQLGQEKRKIEESLSRLKEKLSSLSTSWASDPILINLNLQKACLRLAQQGKISNKKSLITHLENITQSLTLCKTSEFATDVKGLLATLKNETDPPTHRSLQAIFTDDPIDLLLCGTDVSGSCQRLDGDPNLNKGLLGYLIDGKNRLLAIKEGDKIVARCLLRLLWDGIKPVVYRDRFYPDQIPATHKQALNALAKQVSQKLRVPLTCEEGAFPYNNSLQALGGPAPYEYCDGAGGVQKDSRYTIQAKLME